MTTPTIPLPNLTSMPPNDLAAYVGKVPCFVGALQSDRTIGDLPAIRDMARAARQAGIDTLVFRRGNGTLPLPDHDYLIAERDACHGEGVGWLPYLYSYGPAIGTAQIAGECGHLAALGAVNGCVVVDMEIEWDGQDVAAAYFTRLMRPIPTKLIITTFADPVTQRFPVRALAPCADAWAPMDYDNWLAAQQYQQVQTGMTIRYPVLDVDGPEFGANDPAAIAGMVSGDSLWLWEYARAVEQGGLISQVRRLRGWT